MYNTVNSNEVLIVFIDVQEKLVKMLQNKSAAINAVKIAKAAHILNIPCVVTEQYPKGLGTTLPEINDVLPEACRIEKTFFSVYNEKTFSDLLKSNNKKQIVLLGIETHICVLQTAFDLIKAGYEVFVVQDASASRTEENNQAALRRLIHSGVQIITVEMLLFELLKTSKNQYFKEVQALIK